MLLLVDVSISEAELSSVRSFLESIVKRTIVGSDLTRFGIVLYSSRADYSFFLDRSLSEQDVFRAIADVEVIPGQTNTAAALDQCVALLSRSRREPRTRQLVLLVTGREASDAYQLRQSSDRLRDAGVSVLAVGARNANRDQLLTAAGGNTSREFYMNDFDNLNTLTRRVSKTICDISEEPGESVATSTAASSVMRRYQRSIVGQDDFYEVKLQ